MWHISADLLLSISLNGYTYTWHVQEFHNISCDFQMVVSIRCLFELCLTAYSMSKCECVCVYRHVTCGCINESEIDDCLLA